MESSTLNQLAEKYWQGESTEQQEQQLKAVLLDEAVPAELKPLAEYLNSMQAQRNQELDEGFDAEMLALLPAKKLQLRRFPFFLQIAASIILVVGLGFGIQSLMVQEQTAEPIVSEFVDTFEDSELAYQEVKKALMLVSSSMNEGMTYVDRIGEFHKVTTEVENRIELQSHKNQR